MLRWGEWVKPKGGTGEIEKRSTVTSEASQGPRHRESGDARRPSSDPYRE